MCVRVSLWKLDARRAGSAPATWIPGIFTSSWGVLSGPTRVATSRASVRPRMPPCASAPHLSLCAHKRDTSWGGGSWCQVSRSAGCRGRHRRRRLAYMVAHQIGGGYCTSPSLETSCARRRPSAVGRHNCRWTVDVGSGALRPDSIAGLDEPAKHSRAIHGHARLSWRTFLLKLRVFFFSRYLRSASSRTLVRPRRCLW